MRLLVYHIKGKIIEAIFTIFLPQPRKKLGERFVKRWYLVAFNLLIFSSRFCPLLENVSPVARTSFCVVFVTCVSWFFNKLLVRCNKLWSLLHLTDRQPIMDRPWLPRWHMSEWCGCTPHGVGVTYSVWQPLLWPFSPHYFEHRIALLYAVHKDRKSGKSDRSNNKWMLDMLFTLHNFCVTLKAKSLGEMVTFKNKYELWKWVLFYFRFRSTALSLYAASLLKSRLVSLEDVNMAAFGK